ncbi:MAG: hypothetical protein KGH78_04430 [Candidatus Micrarchaeota archaeon]|nr:hypothetical protein [Candidatus Micrarchaeota archaeon]
MRFRRAQSAMEYLMTYGWAILVTAVVLGILFSLGMFKGASGITTTSCIARSGFICSNPIMDSNGLLAVHFGQISPATITLTGIGCSPSAAAPQSTTPVSLQVPSGGTVVLAFSCPISGNAVGTTFAGTLWLQYNTPTASNVIDMLGGVNAKVSTSGNVIAAEGGGISAGGTTTTSTTSTSTTSSSSTSTTSTSTTTTIPAPYLDGHAAATPTTASNSITPKFSTTNPNDMIVAIVFSDGGASPTISDTAGLTWTKQYGGTSGLSGGSCGAAWVFYATPGTTVTNDAVNGVVSGSGYVGTAVFAVANAKSFDPNGSLPPAASGTVTYSTTNPNDFIVGLSVGSCSVNGFSWSSGGLTALDNINFPSFPSWYGDAYKVVSTTQSGASISITPGGYTATVIALSST